VREDEPLPRVVESLRRHLLEEHGLPDFELERDLYWGHNRPSSPRALYLVEVETSPPGFQCHECGYRIFSAPTYGDSLRNLALRRHHSAELAPLLRGLSNEQQEKVIEDWDRGRLASENLERIERKDAQRVKQAGAPEIERRIGACQAFLLDHYREHANKELAIEALCALAKEDPDRHYEVVGRDYPYSRETYRGYWKRIPIERRQAAKAEGLERLAQVKAGRLAEKRRKLTP
jgi:hypothetical protein